jgi:hypothetical protein
LHKKHELLIKICQEKEFNENNVIFKEFNDGDTQKKYKRAPFFTLWESRMTSDPSLSRDCGRRLQLHP